MKKELGVLLTSIMLTSCTEKDYSPTLIEPIFDPQPIEVIERATNTFWQYNGYFWEEQKICTPERYEVFKTDTSEIYEILKDEYGEKLANHMKFIAEFNSVLMETQFFIQHESKEFSKDLLVDVYFQSMEEINAFERSKYGKSYLTSRNNQFVPSE